uniref:KH domain-containing protein n=2 Tax=Bursaphelenchus xylophilus TaxID=6326 RepID=A0A1I7SVA7_BURXY
MVSKVKKTKKQQKKKVEDVEMEDLPDLVPLEDEDLVTELPELDVAEEPEAEQEPEMTVVSRKKGKRKANKSLDVIMEDGEEEETEVQKTSEKDEPMDQEAFDKKQEEKLKKKREGKMTVETDVRRVPIPRHRYSRLKSEWNKIVEPIVQQLKLQVRFNLKTRKVEIRAPKNQTPNLTFLQKAEDFVHAFALGFDVQDAIALIRLDHIFLESFEVQDVKPLYGEHLSRAIGRIAGKDGRTKHTIENVTRTRIVLQDQKIHTMGSFQNLRLARHTLCSLILGRPPSKVYGNLRNLSSRMADRL